MIVSAGSAVPELAPWSKRFAGASRPVPACSDRAKVGAIYAQSSDALSRAVARHLPDMVA
jgi:hypothetical protein